MRRLPARVLFLVLTTLLLSAAPAMASDEDQVTVHYVVSATLTPDTHEIEVVLEIKLPDAWAGQKTGVRKFQLHAGLHVTALEDSDFQVGRENVQYKPGKDPNAGRRLRLNTWVLHAKPDTEARTARMRIRGKIHHPLEMESEEYARSFSRTPGTISSEGVFLGGASWWLPRFGDELLTFRLEVDLPKGWDAVSQGVRTTAKTEAGRRVVVWDCKHPMDEVYLIASKFHEYSRSAGGVLAQAFLRSPDENLANKYLEVTAQYIEMYRKLIGPYAFEKFALIENFWETGYGMPSFTLLGPRVIRFPFILHSSYPHEILHNWWGNSVYVDWETGNWCEGLTAYMADHLIREGQGRGVEYRQDTLKSYRNYVKGAKDFPLTQFRSRHSSATQAVGYGKCLMVFHMLRRDLGDALFTRGLQRFYRAQKWRRASFADLRTAFEDVSDRDLGAFFTQWVDRTGAPDLSIKKVQGSSNGIWLELVQTHGGEPYALTVPVAITWEGQSQAQVVELEMTQKEQSFVLAGTVKALRVDVDPQFDVFRRLHRAEIPPTMSQMFGADRVTLVVPDDSDPSAQGWRQLTKAWSRGGDKLEVVTASELRSLPQDRAVWVLGARNPWRRILQPELQRHGAGLAGEKADFGAVEIPRGDHSFVYVVRHPDNEELAVGWIGTPVSAAIPGLARKLPHYGKYSYLGFQGEAPDNVAKGRWPTTGSPLSVLVDPGGDAVTPGKLPKRKPLARLAPVFDESRLMSHVTWLADPAREGRGAGTKGLDAAADYIAAVFEKAGLKPAGGDGSFFQRFEVENGPEGKTVPLRNVVGVIPGTNPKLAPQSVVLGAHYDHLGRGWPDARAGTKGEIYNGADDNASGVAVLLELAQLLGRTHKPSRTLVFVAFTGEEWGLKGSQHYVRTMKTWPAAKALAMMNMDTVGRLGDKKIQVLGSGTATEWRHIAMGVGFTTGVESECISDDPGGSDQQSFVKVGVPAVQIFTGAHADYHRPTDDIEKIDAAGLVRVATFVRESIVYLCERPEPLTSTLKSSVGNEATPNRTTSRRVSFGTMPDFGFRGPGVKVASVIENSPAAKAGVQKGDILVSIDGQQLKDLRAFSQLLRARAPGDVVKVRIRRGDQEQIVEATLVAR